MAVLNRWLGKHKRQQQCFDPEEWKSGEDLTGLNFFASLAWAASERWIVCRTPLFLFFPPCHSNCTQLPREKTRRPAAQTIVIKLAEGSTCAHVFKCNPDSLAVRLTRVTIEHTRERIFRLPMTPAGGKAIDTTPEFYAEQPQKKERRAKEKVNVRHHHAEY